MVSLAGKAVLTNIRSTSSPRAVLGGEPAGEMGGYAGRRLTSFIVGSPFAPPAQPWFSSPPPGRGGLPSEQQI